MNITSTQHPTAPITPAKTYSPKFHTRKLRADRIIKYILIIAASISILIVLAQIFFLGLEGFPALKYVDLFGREWVPVSEIQVKFGLLPLIAGSLLVTIASMLFAIPVGVGVAIFIAEIAPPKLRAFLKGLVEILAGIPSVVYGFWGMNILTVFLKDTFNRNSGHSALAGGILLAIMALPTIVSISEDALSVVPNEYREASIGLGVNKWQTISQVVVPSASSGITTAIILGMGRAIGETMAVIMVTGNSSIIPTPFTDLWSRVRTITATVAIEMPETPYNTPHYHMLFLMILFLFFIIIVINAVAELILARMKEKFNPTKTMEIKEKKPIGNFLIKYKKLISKTVLQVLGYLILQTWMRWWVAGLLTLLITALFQGFANLKPKPQQIVAFTILIANFLIVFAVLVVILYFIVKNGIPALFSRVDGTIKFNWTFLTESPYDNLRAGGILPAILGTLYLILGSILLAVPIGILGGIYLAEYAKENKLTRTIRMAIDNLNGTPSIVFGMFGMIVFCILPKLNKSLWAGQATLALMILPTIIRTAEESVKSIDQSVKEGSLALGATKWYTISRVVLPAASPGIITGIILGMGRSAGETAPIMLTAVTGYSQSNPTRLTEPVMALSYHLYYLSTSQPDADIIAGGTALVLLVMVLILYGIAMIIRSSIKGKNKASFFY